MLKQMERDEKDGPKGRIRSVVRNFVEEVVGQRGSEQYRAFLAEKVREKEESRERESPRWSVFLASFDCASFEW